MSQVLESFARCGQNHVVEAYRQLADENAKAAFLRQLQAVDHPEKLVGTVLQALSFSSTLAQSRSFAQLPSQSTGTLLEDHADLQHWKDLGLDAIAKNQVAVLLLAGGQGTRLGLTEPKGCFDIGLPSHKSLFQIQAEKILRIQSIAQERSRGDKVRIYWYIMTLGPTRAATESFFQTHGFFGLDQEQIVFFNQGTLPCFDLDGKKILMQDEASICESPDGNGGLYKAMQKAQILQHMKEHGILHVHMYCVDNCLVKVADPLFVGFAIDRGYELATKAVRKRDALESVGLIVMDADTRKPCVIEYSEIGSDLAHKMDPADASKLYLRAANIVNHYYSVELLERMLGRWTDLQEHLPFHIARKKIACYDVALHEFVKPQEPNGIKLEQFIFDVFSLVDLAKFGCLEVDRAEEFSPLKNGPLAANDNPASCRKHYLELGTQWVRAAGGRVPDDALVEVTGLTSYNGENLAKRDYHDGEII